MVGMVGAVVSGRRVLAVALCATVVGLALPAIASGQTAAVLFERATAREAAGRGNPTIANIRAAVSAYEHVVLRYPRSGFCDDALWNGGVLARVGWERFRQAADKNTATRLFTWLRKEYPTSARATQVPAQLTALNAAPKPPPPARPAPPVSAPPPPTPRMGAATLRAITRTSIPRGDRVIIELDREVLYSSKRIAGPDRVFFDLQQTDLPAGVQTSAEALTGSRLRTVRLGRQDARTIRVVLELAGAPDHSVFALYHPYRLVVDLESDTPPPAASGPVTLSAPASMTSGGDYSLARQLGLGVSRIVIDAGHGGHDPGATANGVAESELVLDIALRVEAFLKKQPGVNVILTRRTDVFIPLEKRTAIANREGADLFLSIHANASPRVAARGVETYFLNFATNPAAEAVAARENATSSTSMGKLSDLVQQIMLNAKVKESREFAQMVQTSMVRGLRTQNKAVLDLGVKQAPFVVLIGARMPSVLAEISFVSNRAEARLLKQDAYRQRIAQSLADAVLKYQTSLKKITTVATSK